MFFVYKYFSNFLSKDPRWFNKISIRILEIGKEKIKNVLEKTEEFLNENKQETNYKKAVKMLEELKVWIEGKKRSFFNPGFSSDLVVKKSFQEFLSNILKFLNNIVDLGFEKSVVSRLKKFFWLKEHEDISQVIYVFTHKQFEQFVQDIIRSSKLGSKIDKSFKSYAEKILLQFGYVSPKEKSQVFDHNIVNSYIVPFLFPDSKIMNIYTKDNQKIDKLNFNQHWEAVYQLKFKPSSMWKVLFVKIRGACVYELTTIEQEVYWKSGNFYFYFVFI